MPRFLVVGLLLASLGCTPRDGDLLRQIARKTGDKLEGATAPLGRIRPAAGPSVSHTSDLAGRVQARLRWDRYLAGARIEVRGQDGGVVLAGKVTEPSVKQRALDLARSTVGVQKVTDEVKVASDE